MSVCIIEDCGGKRLARGLCRTHYERWSNGADIPSLPTTHGLPVAERFWMKVDKNGPEFADLGSCWEWTAGLDNHGYGQFNSYGKPVKAYAFATDLAGIAVPKGFTRDHLCRNRICVNPGHIEIVTRGENVRRGDAGLSTGAKNRAKTHCRHGHEFTESNTHITKTGSRTCRPCKAAGTAAYRKRKEAS